MHNLLALSELFILWAGIIALKSRFLLLENEHIQSGATEMPLIIVRTFFSTERNLPARRSVTPEQSEDK